jgi:hypothetical protein
MRFTTSMKMLVMMMAVALLLPGMVVAQNLTQGAISGTVTDAKGAIMPNITVKLTSLDRGYTREAKTNAQGVFQFPLVDLGPYKLTVNAPGGGSYLGSFAVSGGHTTEVLAKLGGAVKAQGDAATAEEGEDTAEEGAAPKKTPQFLLGGILAAGIDSRKAKASDEVVIKTIGDEHLSDGTLIPNGSKIIGHVTEAKARAGSDPESSLGIAFEKLELKGGKTLMIAGVMRAVGPAPEPKSGGGIDYGFFGLNQVVEHVQASTNWAPMPGLNGDSVGVVGIKGMELTTDGVLKSSDKTVKLDYGAQIILKAEFAGEK